MNPDLWVLEKKYFSRGFRVAGVDEAGRGPLAGPVVAAAVCAREMVYIDHVYDSKSLTPQKRAALKKLILAHPSLSVGIGVVSVEEIDAINILNASLLAFSLALKQIKDSIDIALLDGNKTSPYWDGRQEAIVKGDQKSFLISAASIIAKETRDELMSMAHHRFPEYQFSRHKGYGTKLHLEALTRFGPCEIHRKSFKPVRDLMITISSGLPPRES